MKTTINLYQFREGFRKLDITNFSHVGLEALYEYLEDIDPDMEYDPIAFCWHFYEATLEELASETLYDLETDDPDEIIEHLEDNTTVIFLNENDREAPSLDTTVIIENF